MFEKSRVSFPSITALPGRNLRHWGFGVVAVLMKRLRRRRERRCEDEG